MTFDRAAIAAIYLAPALTLLAANWRLTVVMALVGAALLVQSFIPKRQESEVKHNERQRT